MVDTKPFETKASQVDEIRTIVQDGATQPSMRRRVMALHMLHMGFSYEEVGHAMNIFPGTVYTWAKLWEKHGTQSLEIEQIDRHHTLAEAQSLTRQQQAASIRLLEAGHSVRKVAEAVIASTDEVRNWYEEWHSTRSSHQSPLSVEQYGQSQIGISEQAFLEQLTDEQARAEGYPNAKVFRMEHQLSELAAEWRSSHAQTVVDQYHEVYRKLQRQEGWTPDLLDIDQQLPPEFMPGDIDDSQSKPYLNGNH